MWCFPAVGRERELVWLRATRSKHVGVTRITHQAAMRLGLTQSVTKAYQVRLRLSGEPRFILRAEGVETLECVRSKSERKDTRVLQPDVVGLEQGAAIRDERLGNPRADALGSDRACHQVAFEDEPERRFPDIPQRGIGSDEEAVRHHPRGRGEYRRIV
jgi:hypothetical protein